MNLQNATKMQAGYTGATRPDGRDLVVVVVKGTFQIPDNPDQEPVLAKEQAELVPTDTFSGEPAFSAPVYENDYAPRKPHCDLLLNGSAYAPRGKPVDRVSVSLRVGALTKTFEVVGNRVWKAGTLGISSTSPEPFTILPISYDNAFGGVDKSQEDELKFRWYPTNFAGVGYHEYTAAKFVDGKPLPNTEERGHPVSNPRGSYRPMSFGPIGRAWQPRPKLAGTYDQKWLDEKCPFLPDDFKDEYYQAAPADQQTDYLNGGEVVELTNLTPQGRTVFRLPTQLEMAVLFFLRTGEMIEAKANLDTLLLEPDCRRFMLVWRTSQPVRRTIREVQQMVVGRTAHDFEEQQRRQRRQSRKRRFPSLRELVKSAGQSGRG